MKIRLISLVLNGISAGILSAGWISHCGEKSVFVPVLVGLGTTFFYAYSSHLFAITSAGRSILLISGISLIILSAYILKYDQFVLTTFFFLLLTCYSTTFSNYGTLRQIPLLKSIFISICWTFFVLILPIWLTLKTFTFSASELVLMSLLFYALTIPSDIRDINSDPKSMKTLPQLTGYVCAGRIGITLIALFGIGFFFLTKGILFLFFVALAIYISLLFLKRKTKFILLILDGLLTLLGVLFFYI